MTHLFMLGALLTAGPAMAQTAPPQTSSQTSQTPAPLLPLAPKPAASAPAPKPVAFPPDARVAFINMQVIFGDSNLGRQGMDRLKTLNDRLSAGLAARDKEIQGLTDRIRTQQGVVTTQVAVTWNKDLQRLQREAQFARQEAQVQVEQLQEEVLADFQAAVKPVLDAVREDKGLLIIFAIEEGSALSIATAHPGVDLSAEIVKRLNAGK
jgi:Skp family chaperone for outer membrane proteins